jgi:hypothetical protein
MLITKVNENVMNFGFILYHFIHYLKVQQQMKLLIGKVNENEWIVMNFGFIPYHFIHYLKVQHQMKKNL